MLFLICAVVERSSNTLASWRSCFLILTPPIRSAAFSRFASHLAAVEEAPFSDRTNTEEPRAVGWTKASAWMEMNRSAWTALAFWTRVPSGTKKSALRVMTTRILGCCSIFAFSRLPMARTTSFSLLPLAPMAPESSPPWPGSTTMVTIRFSCIFPASFRGSPEREVFREGASMMDFFGVLATTWTGSGSFFHSPFIISAAIGSSGSFG